MTKRITALLLALLMVIGTVPAPAFAADDGNATEETTQTVCSVCNLADCTATHTQCEKCGNYDCTADHSNWCDICKKNDCGVDHSIQILAGLGDAQGASAEETPVDQCPYCEETTAEDGTVTHAPNCNAAYVYDGTADVGKYVKVAQNASIQVSGDHDINTAAEFRYEEFSDELIMTITDWYWDSGDAALWYLVKAYSGSFPADEEWPETAWILYDYTDTSYEFDASLEFTTVEEKPEEDVVTEEEQTESGLNIAVEGQLPEGTTLSVADVEVNREAFEIAEDETILAAVDIKLLAADKTEYQPVDEGKRVLVTLDAQKMGLSDGDIVTLRHEHNGEVTVYEPYVVIDGKLAFWANQFSVYVVSNVGSTLSTGQVIQNGIQYEIELGETVVFYEDTRQSYNNQGNALNRSVWQVTDTGNAVTYTVVHSALDEWGNPVFAPWIEIKAIDQGTVTLTHTYWNKNQNKTTTTTFTVVVKAPEPGPDENRKLYIDDQVDDNGCLVPAWSGTAPENVHYVWTRSDDTDVRLAALAADGKVNISIDRGGLYDNTTPITYTLTAYDQNDAVLDTAEYTVLYGHEILNRSFEEPGNTLNFTSHQTVHNGYPGLYWKTTAPGTGGNLGLDVELVNGDPSDGVNNPHGVPNAADGKYFAEINAEEFGTLYQDMLTTPGSELTWSFSHTKRNVGRASQVMYVIVAATEYAQNIIGLADVSALLQAAKAQLGNGSFPTGNAYLEGFEFTYGEDQDGNPNRYRIWRSEATTVAQTSDGWQKLSGTYTVPEGQYLTRLFFASETEVDKIYRTQGNLIDGVYAGEKMNYIVLYYVDGNVVSKHTEERADVTPNTSHELINLNEYLTKYQYPIQILVNGKAYPGTLADLQEGLYVTDYGDKIGSAEGYRQQIVLQLYFQEPNIIATKTVEVVGMTASQINEILNNGGFEANMKLDAGDENDTFEAKFNITQYSSSNKLTMESSFVDSNGAYVTAEDYEKTFTVSETSATRLPNYKLVTTIKTGNDKDNLSAGNTVKITTEDTIGFVDVTNTYYPMGNLQVSKFVETGLNGIGITDDQKNHQFDFTVTLDGTIPAELRGPYDYTIKTFADSAVPSENDQTNETGKLTLTESALTFKLKHNQYIVIEGLPAVDYTITETQRDGYQKPSFILEHPYYTTDGSFKGYITVGDTEEVQCSNAPVVSLGDLKITKNVEDYSNLQNAPNQGFNFTVTLNNVNNLIIKGPESENDTEEVVVESTFNVVYTSTKGTVSADQLKYTVGGTDFDLSKQQTVTPKYVGDATYTVELTLYDGLTATIEGLPQCTYHVKEDDYSAQKFEATYENETGTLGGPKENGKNPVTAVTCTNTYPMDSGNLVIKKTVMKEYDRDPMGADTFTFTIEPQGDVVLDEKEKYAVEIKVTDVTQETVAEVKEGKLTVDLTFEENEMEQVTKDQPLVKSMTIYDLPFGKYTVTEAENAAYRQSVPENTEDQSNLTVEVTVAATPVEVGFQNEFKRITGTLTITKKVMGTVDGAFLFHVTGTDAGGKTIDMDVIIDEFSNGTGYVTIHDLPIGKYTVKEDTNWNWRYTTDVAEETAQITADDRQGNVEFTNTYNNSKWLNFFVNTLNEFKLP